MRRTAARLLAVVLTTLALATAGALTAGGAHAATGKTWNRLADCESGRDWDIDTGNGFYGGLQFSTPTWRAYDGRQYARRADLATRLQQIRTAELLLADRGWAPWPGCTKKLGLTQADADEPFVPGGGGGGGGGGDPEQQTYTVRAGDTLSSIARAFDVEGGWRALYEANRDVIGPDPDTLPVGTVLTIP